MPSADTRGIGTCIHLAWIPYRISYSIANLGLLYYPVLILLSRTHFYIPRISIFNNFHFAALPATPLQTQLYFRTTYSCSTKSVLDNRIILVVDMNGSGRVDCSRVYIIGSLGSAS